MPSPGLGAGPVGLGGWKNPRANSQLLCVMPRGCCLLWVGFVPVKMRVWTSQSSGLSWSALGFPWEKEPFPSRCTTPSSLEDPCAHLVPVGDVKTF